MNLRDPFGVPWPFVDPETGIHPEPEQWERHCPLSMVDAPTVSLIELARRLDAGQIVLSLDEACDLPPLLWETRDFLKLCDKEYSERSSE